MVYVGWPEIFSLPSKFIYLLINYDKFEDEKIDINIQKFLILCTVFFNATYILSIDATAVSQTLKLACNTA